MTRESYGGEGEFIGRGLQAMPNGDREEIWKKIWDLSSDIASIKSKGCAQRENDLEMIRDLKSDVRWMIRIGLVTMLGVLGVLLKPLILK
jgi:hypothetical protein